MLSDKLRRVRVYILIVAIIAVYTRLAIMVYQHWRELVEAVRYTLFREEVATSSRILFTVELRRPRTRHDLAKSTVGIVRVCAHRGSSAVRFYRVKTMQEITPLRDLASAINREHRNFQSAAKFALKAAFDVGRLLTEAKAQLEHGAWLPWVKANCHFGERRAQAYMRLHAHRKEVDREMRSQTSHFAGLDAALQLIREPRRIEAHTTKSEEPEPSVPVHFVKVSQKDPAPLGPARVVKVVAEEEEIEFGRETVHIALTVDLRRPIRAARTIYNESGAARWEEFVEEIKRLDEKRPPRPV
jgi:hypothetical protein